MNLDLREVVADQSRGDRRSFFSKKFGSPTCLPEGFLKLRDYAPRALVLGKNVAEYPGPIHLLPDLSGFFSGGRVFGDEEMKEWPIIYQLQGPAAIRELIDLVLDECRFRYWSIVPRRAMREKPHFDVHSFKLKDSLRILEEFLARR
jgi:hypothetical protein